MQEMAGAIVAGLVLGIAGGTLHLLCTRLRAGLIVDGRNVWAALLFPVGLAFVGLAVWLGSRIAAEAAWASVLGLFAVRAAVLSSKPRHGAT